MTSIPEPITPQSPKIPAPKIDQQKAYKEFLDSTGTPFIVLKYFHRSHQCFSDWQGKELKKFAVFNERLKEVTWKEIEGAGALGYKKLSRKTIPQKLPKYQSIVREVSPEYLSENGVIEFRLSNKSRIFGVKIGCGFFLLILDKSHKVFQD